MSEKNISNAEIYEKNYDTSELAGVKRSIHVQRGQELLIDSDPGKIKAMTKLIRSEIGQPIDELDQITDKYNKKVGRYTLSINSAPEYDADEMPTGKTVSTLQITTLGGSGNDADFEGRYDYLHSALNNVYRRLSEADGD